MFPLSSSWRNLSSALLGVRSVDASTKRFSTGLSLTSGSSATAPCRLPAWTGCLPTTVTRLLRPAPTRLVRVEPVFSGRPSWKHAFHAGKPRGDGSARDGEVVAKHPLRGGKPRGGAGVASQSYHKTAE